MSFKYGMLAPLLALFGVAVGFPLCYALYLSVTDYKLTDRGTPDFVGVTNFADALSNSAFWEAFGTTAIYVVIAVSCELVIGFAIALSLYRQRWAKDLARAVVLAPMFITPIAVGLIFRFLLNDQIGAVPALLHAVGADYDFFGSGRALITLAFIDVWQWTPFMVLLILAGLESMPKQPLEAARVDGAGPVYLLRRVLIPMLAPVLTVAVLLRGLDALRTFEYIYATTRGGPGTQTQTLQYFMYLEGIQFFRLASASAMAFIVLVLVLGVIVVVFRAMERNREDMAR
ncbi:binding-protein-dependent transport system inner membrane protein [Mycolicibacterium phlei]|jgi:multiple sugar transport system permease protein|uniref:ABC transporter permease n=1 Tax=Mycolicibacterium phlei DSM 43239 = CCUG 21000 TaxID=1226750 RepID=A0A5N5V4J9_MYCPH|nr:sugar ABC transporter permease [Mycolicibacterium phlei]VEG08365.1 binding-protein-dependent transport system inner membrane protein [Mycobacteroides chelonae]AMO60245.1 Trehalose transport system permease protein SugA [Mycolicibacterium phlei]EID14957.1 binding-protein-dependent transport system inner membrane protein [Mycolicibacterium phlei RIVM601174]KAB7756706.1 ABC transporter permease [Mycolicibacterium phlei DSM 43239 = CCUG 21000]KXW63594.1 ABC transporter permease [Mycolicibacteri